MNEHLKPSQNETMQTTSHGNANDSARTGLGHSLQIELPQSLRTQLAQFRSRVRKLKMLEAAGIACFAFLAGFLAVFLVDRLMDPSPAFRWIVFAVSAIGLGTIPVWFERWVVRYTTPSSLARLMSLKQPNLGDSLLSAIELSQNPHEQQRSPALCRAALQQVAEDTSTRDLAVAAPDSYHRRWWVLVTVVGAIAGLLAMLYPAAATNALARFVMPWSNTERYTFAQLGEFPTRWIVPHGESIDLTIPLSNNTPWKPSQATLWLGSLAPSDAALGNDRYNFPLPPQIEPSKAKLKIGDARPSIEVVPTLRPELVSASATVNLPEYLKRAEPLTKDVRSGTLSIVEGATFSVEATATRNLASATIDGVPTRAQGSSIFSENLSAPESHNYQFRWTDELGLGSKGPFALQLNVRADEEPSVFLEGLPRTKVVLDSEQLKFSVHSTDDFGVKQVGMEWRPAETGDKPTGTPGEWLVAAGGPTAEKLDADAVFQATALNIAPQAIELRIYAEDYLPGRARTYSAPHLIYVLSPSDHAMWVLQQFNRWQREAMEVRDREIQLLEGNKRLRQMSSDELAREETRKQIEQQAAAEQANARRLSGLTSRGEELLRQAARNSEIGVGHLEKWAEMQKILKDISANRMPSVANLLKQAAKQPSPASPQNNNNPKIAGSNRNDATPNSAPSETDPNAPAKPTAPRVIDSESTQQPIDQIAEEEAKKKKASKGALGLPTTTLMGNGKSGKTPPAPESPASVDQAVEEQLALLEEFDKVSEELNKIMANLEGSTLVKRFKAAAREQIQVADSTSDAIPTAFGNKLKRLKPEERSVLEKLSARENTALNTVGQIIDDLESFHERRPMVKFRDVLDDIEREDPLGGLRKLSSHMTEQQGIAIAEAEYWSDTFDRWAEDLVDPASKGQCPGGKSKSSLPPSIVLEVMQILESEMNLRDRTRVAEQAKSPDSAEQYKTAVKELVTTQSELRERIVRVSEKISELPNGEEEFGKELQLMAQVNVAMKDAVRILSRPDTGRPAIAAETEVIELLLSSKRINPKGGGGGGGSNPGGGGTGDTTDAAIAMIGPGLNEKEVRQDHKIDQATGTEDNTIPEEFRHGLDQYFERVDRRKSQ